MGADAASRGEVDPGAFYARRLRELESSQQAEQKQEKLLGYAKVAVAFATILSALILLYFTKLLWLLLLPVGAFIWLAILHENRLQQMRLRARSIEFYKRGVARLEDRWAGTGETGERFLDESHPYARDLDIFGRASLFELLSNARTRSGEEQLATWLMAPAPRNEVVARHGAVRELSARVNLREDLFCLGETVRAGVHPEKLAKWGEQ